MANVDVARARFARCGSLAQVIVAGLALEPPWSVADVVVQDEFTHDVVMAADGVDAALVLDCT